MSLDLKVMEEIEEKAPEINTGYVIPSNSEVLAIKVDFFVIEDFSYQELLVPKRPKQQGHEVYCLDHQ